MVPVAEWFYRSDEDLIAIGERLRLTRCSRCQVVGALNWHGYLRGFDDSNPPRKTVRARRVFCSNRNARTGCGHTFSVWFADKIRRLSLSTTALWAFLQCAVAGSILAAIRAADGHLSERTWQRVWKRFNLGQDRDPHGPVGPLPAARTAGGTPAGGAHPRPSPGRLPRRRLSHHRLPTNAADLLRLSPVPASPLTHR